MFQSKAHPGTPAVPVDTKLNQRLAAYVAVASAAGIGVLITAPTAEANVVYTPTNISVGFRSAVPIDLNNDGIADLQIVTRFCSSHATCLEALPAAAGNGVRGHGFSRVVAGFFGVPVGPGEQFLTGSYNIMALAGAYGPYSWSAGAWKNVTNRYLGVKFLINGNTHYGWVRMSVNIKKGPITITGYAYETTPNTNIIEGHTGGVSSVRALAPADLIAPAGLPSLGVLARGADGIALWRREREVVA